MALTFKNLEEDQRKETKISSSPELVTGELPKGFSQVKQSSSNEATYKQIKRIPLQQSVKLNDSSSTATSQNNNLDILHNNNRYKPSKIFISKCRAELESLLTAIKGTYHQEIKNLYTQQIHPDLFIQFDQEEFKKPLHKVLLASRAFKLYNLIKAFKLVEVKTEEDIIIGQFQDKVSLERHEKIETDSSGSVIKEDFEIQEGEDEFVLICNLPKDLINLDLLSQFAQRLYLDLDISDEEINFNQKLFDWLKQNKPELIKVPEKHSPNHKDTFRTVRPDFEETQLPSRSSLVMSPQESINYNPDAEGNMEDQEETSQSANMREVSLTGSVLTRTETFELLTKSYADRSPTATPSGDVLIDQNEDERKENGPGIAGDDSISSYAPTTRTGLKPKTFTTPVDMRAGRSSVASSSSSATRFQSGSFSSTKKSDSATSAAAKSTTQKSNPNKLASSQNSASNSSKRSSLSSNLSDSNTEPSKTSNITKSKILGTASTTTKPKANIIVRAQPISMERSQSPGTNAIKGPSKNFIAANKRYVSQIEKKPVINETQMVDEIETEISDANYILEPLTTSNMVAQMDKFTLISCSKLAESLSRMFIDELLSDTIIIVKDEKQIKAHKCILSTRSAYLAEVLTKQCLPSNNSLPHSGLQPLKIDLTEFTYSTVYFSMLHIYSGIVKVPDDIDIDELTKLTHHLHVTTLTQVCLQNLRMNYCHFFHKPCNACCVGVLKTLPLAWRYDYTELYSKCLQWIGSHFSSVFCLREFAELQPTDLLEECYSATLSQLTPDNIIPKTIECQKLLKSLPRVKWTEPIICLVGRQLEDFCRYKADNYEKILQSESFMNLSKNCWECEVLEENLLAAMNQLKPDSGCKTLIQLHKIECSIESHCDDSRNVSDSFANLISKMRKYCERYLLKEAAAVVHCSSWRHMSSSLQKRIKDQAIISTDFEEPTKQLAAKPKLPSMSRHSQSSPSPGIGDFAKSPSNRSTPDSKIKSPNTTLLPPPKNKPAAARHIKVLK